MRLEYLKGEDPRQLLEKRMRDEGRLPALAAAATEALRQWVYQPTLVNGVPTPVILEVTLEMKP